MLLFSQSNDSNGSCACKYQGLIFDHCDMNRDLSYTQAHLVLARLSKTLGFMPEIKVIAGTNVTPYSPEEIVEMAKYLLDFTDVRPYSHIQKYLEEA